MAALETLPQRHQAAHLVHELCRPASAAVIAQLPVRPGRAVAAEVVRDRTGLQVKQFWTTVSRLEQLRVLHRNETGLSLDHDQLDRLLNTWVADSPLHPIIANHQRVASYVQWGRITRMPTDPALLDEVYAALIELFRRGETLTEAEVNTRIRVVHDDPAEVRRALVDRGRLRRTPGTAVYHRP